MHETKNTPDYLVLVNGEHRLSDDFEDAVEIISVENAVGESYKVEKKPTRRFCVCGKTYWKTTAFRRS